MLAPTSLRPHPLNDNQQSPWMFGKLLATIQEEGFSQPIVARSGDSRGPFKDGLLEILGGEQRWRAAQKLKLGKIPVFDLGAVDDQRARKLIINLNKLHGDPDQDALSRLMRTIVAEGGEASLESLPFDEDTLKDLLDGEIPNLDAPSPDNNTAEPQDTVTVAEVGVGVTPRDLLVVLEVQRLPKTDLEALVEAGRQWAFGRSDMSVPAWQELMELFRRHTKVKA